jgi:hypothetical protein
VEANHAKPSSDAPYAVQRFDQQYSLVARRPLAPGETVLVLAGSETDKPSLGSVQVGEYLHVEVPEGLSFTRVLDECPWRFLNHACEPNTYFSGRRLIVLRPIAVGEPITFDYETTEWEIASPFACDCGAPNCRSAIVRGFKPRAPQRRSRAESDCSQRLLPRHAAPPLVSGSRNPAVIKARSPSSGSRIDSARRVSGCESTVAPKWS